MAANKFATMLHKNTNKISLILIYAVLEWILIVLLLLNSLFSYLIIKFAEYVGLKPPCLWCTRLDHIFDPAKKNKNMHRDLLCEAHSKEISKLGYCSNHQKLVESEEMCEDCLSSRPEINGLSKNFAFFPWMKDLGMIQRDEEKVGENGEVSLNCSCCGVSLDSKNHNRYSSYILLKTPSWDVLECDHKENLIVVAGDYDDNHIRKSCGKISDFATNLWDGEKILEDKNVSVLSGFDGGLEVTENETMIELKRDEDQVVNVVLEMEEEKETLMEENSNMIMIDKSVQVCVEDSPIEISSQHLEFFLDYSGHRLVPIELVDSIEEHQRKENANFEYCDENEDQESGLDYEFRVEKREGLVVDNVSGILKVNAVLDVDINEEPKFAELDSIEIEEDENSLVFHAKDFEEFTAFLVDKIPSEDVSDIQELAGAEEDRNSYALRASEEVAQMVNNENEADISIGTEIPDLDITDEIQIQESVHSHESTCEDPSTNSVILYDEEHHGPVQVEEQMVELKPLSVQERDHMLNNPQSFYSELYEIEEDKVPDTPTSVDSLNQLHKKLLLLEKKESGTEESLDGSVTSELEGSDGIVTMERLKSALRAERKTLQALYAELEEERSASAVAANQTMAMINRLQEEKAAMQMEALQYQRMMDEQSDYDQEALELLNELMVKREKEKLELEKELEACRKKLLDFETKEKLRALKRSKDGSIRSGFSSASCSNGDDSDGLSIDLNQEAKEEEEGFYRHQEYTPVYAAVNLEESLADFEEERDSILEQLKMLEEKLMTMEDDDHKEKHFEDVTEMEDFQEENGNHVDDKPHSNTDANGHTNGFLMNGKHHQHRRITTQKGKSLLPLFDAISDDNGDEISNGNANGIHSNGMHHSGESKSEIDNKNIAIEEEVDHLYQRLQAFEADREFLKHCFNSLKKGDKGMDLLQEILQHLRDLRNVELRARSLSDNAII